MHTLPMTMREENIPQKKCLLYAEGRGWLWTEAKAGYWSMDENTFHSLCNGVA
jgi:hypothetical protein